MQTEAPGQSVNYRRKVPANEEELVAAEKEPFIRQPSSCFLDDR
jgi:hypothetical protein